MCDTDLEGFDRFQLIIDYDTSLCFSLLQREVIYEVYINVIGDFREASFLFVDPKPGCLGI